MKVTIHMIYDLLTQKDKVMGLNDHGYELAMDFMRNTYSHGRYKYFAMDAEIDIQWDMTEEECRNYVKNRIESGAGCNTQNDYCGAMFFGNFKLEFITTFDGNYHNLFHYGVEGYDELEDGTPYCDESDDFLDHSRRTMEGFAETIEGQIVWWLNEHTDFIDDAVKETNLAKWYPGTRSNYMRTVTRRA